MLRLTAAPLFALVCLIGGCFEDSNPAQVAVYPTMLSVDPTMFRGTIPCGAPGLAKYVVTLTNVTIAPEAGIDRTLPSTAPVPCNSVASFGQPPLVVWNLYIGAIDGYDRDDITPSADGSREMLDSSGALVAPRWTTTCGEPPPVMRAADAGDDFDPPDGQPEYNWLRYPTQVLGTAEVTLRGCLPFTDVTRPDASADDGGVEGSPDRADTASEAEIGTNPADDASGQDALDGAPDDGPEEDGQ